MQEISKRNIENIRRELGGFKSFTNTERDIFIKIYNFPPARLQHQTKVALTGEKQGKKLHLLSYRFLKEQNITPASTVTKDFDITGIKNDDFVFFTVDFTGRKINEKPHVNRLKPKYYGDHAYFIEEHHGEYGYLTLTDQYCSQVEIPFRNNRKDQIEFFEKYELDDVIFCSMAKRDITDEKGNSPIFSYNDMRVAIALYTIKFLRGYKSKNVDGTPNKNDRRLDKEDFANVLLQATYEELACLFEVLFNMEYHIPRHLVVTEDNYSHFDISDQNNPQPIHVPLTNIESDKENKFQKFKRKVKDFFYNYKFLAFLSTITVVPLIIVVSILAILTIIKYFDNKLLEQN